MFFWYVKLNIVAVSNSAIDVVVAVVVAFDTSLSYWIPLFLDHWSSFLPPMKTRRMVHWCHFHVC